MVEKGPSQNPPFWAMSQKWVFGGGPKKGQIRQKSGQKLAEKSLLCIPPGDSGTKVPRVGRGLHMLENQIKKSGHGQQRSIGAIWGGPFWDQKAPPPESSLSTFGPTFGFLRNREILEIKESPKSRLLKSMVSNSLKNEIIRIYRFS